MDKFAGLKRSEMRRQQRIEEREIYEMRRVYLIIIQKLQIMDSFVTPRLWYSWLQRYNDELF